MGNVRALGIILSLAMLLMLFAAVACEDENDDDAGHAETAPTATVSDADDSSDGTAAVKGHDDDGAKLSRDDKYAGMLEGDFDDELFATLISEVIGSFSEAAFEEESGAIGESQDAGIWVNGVGTVSAPPDLVELDLGVSATAETVSEARESAATAMTAIVGYLTGSGIEEKDIRTRHFSIHPQYDWQEIIRPGGGRINERVLTGYQVTNTAIVLVRDMDRASELLDGAVEAGGDVVRVNGINFTIEDTTGLARQAREKAVADAMAKAAQLAAHSGVTLGRLVLLSEVTGGQPAPFSERAFAVAADASVATPLSPGEQDVRVTVLAVFDIE